jgi:hypothetical protein
MECAPTLPMTYCELRVLGLSSNGSMTLSQTQSYMLLNIELLCSQLSRAFVLA